VTTQDGNTVQVITTDTTLIQKYTNVTVDALEPGEQVMVSGSTGDDGTITARSIRSMSDMQIGIEAQPTAQP
jgi:hydrogenase maturation factor